MKPIRLLTFLLFIFSRLFLAAEPPLQLAIQDTGEPVRWDTVGQFYEKKNPPLIVVSIPFPLDREPGAYNFPPPHIPVLLQLELTPGLKEFSNDYLEPLSRLLREYKHISHLSLRGWEQIQDFNHLVYIIKTITSLVRGIQPEIQIAIASPAGTGGQDPLEIYRTLATNPETSPYFDCFFLAPAVKEKIREEISAAAPQIYFWEALAPFDNPGNSAGGHQPAHILSGLLANDPFEKPGTSVLVIPAREIPGVYAALARFSDYLMMGLYKDTSGVKVTYGDGTTAQLPLFFRASDHTPILFVGGNGGGKANITLEKGLYQRAFVENIIDGNQAVFKINRDSQALMLNLKKDFFAVHLIPHRQKITNSRYNVNVTGKYQLSANEIIARVRAWKTVQKNQVKSFTADMTTSMRLRIGNLKDTFDLTIKGPMFSERDKPYDWVWKEFYVNGVKWKSKRVPKIPLLQPEKVNILPLDINLTEDYNYSLESESSVDGQDVYVVDFKPKKELDTTSLYHGKIWIDTDTFAVLREHLIQLNLKGEVLSNMETRHFQPVPGAEKVWLPLSVLGHQVFSTAGRVTNIEHKVTLENVRINPSNFEELKEQAHQSDFQMVRDTEKGLRYLVKDKKSDSRKVEWETKKSQLFGVIGGFYDSSIGYPVPILGANYMNFNLGGKGRQVNILFGGIMLTANYSDPSFRGTKIDLGLSMIAVGFPLKTKIYRQGTEIDAERLKNWPLRFQIDAGFPLGPYVKYSSFFVFEYNKFSLTDVSGAGYRLPANTFTLGWRSRLTFNIKGYRLSLLSEIARRLRWHYWGLPDNEYYNPNQRSYLRWRVELEKDFFVSTFRKIHLSAGYYDGSRLDRFSAYKFGFFNELNLHGYMSGVVQASRAYMLNLSYGYSLGKTFRLEVFYDSTLVTSPTDYYRNTYFSGTALSGTINVPGLNGILRFETGMPVVSHGVKGLVVYFVLLKMF